MGTQLYLSADGARHLKSRIDPVERLADLLYDQERMLQHEIEDLSPV